MQKIKNELKGVFTKYWEYMALHTACKIGLFDIIANEQASFNNILGKVGAKEKVFEKLIDFLIDEGFIIHNNNKLKLTEKAEFLTENNPDSLKNACILWGMEHMDAWQSLDETVLTGEPYFENYFNYISSFQFKLENYHKAMAEYARDDYKNICNIVDFSTYKKIMDIGGGLGVLLQIIKNKYPEKQYFLFEKPEVISIIKGCNINCISGDFFNSIPIIADLILLSRVLHDWDDKHAQIILKNVYINKTVIYRNIFRYFLYL